MTRIYLDFLWWIASFGTINLNGQVRYNNPVLIDKEEPSSPRLPILLIIIMLVVYKQQDVPILYILTNSNQAKVCYFTILLIWLRQNICNIIQWWSGQNLLPHPLLALQKPGSLPAGEFDWHSFLVRDETEEILDSILPPREWEEDGENKIIQSRIGTQYYDALI